eukprot:EG_transcript_30712
MPFSLPRFWMFWLSVSVCVHLLCQEGLTFPPDFTSQWLPSHPSPHRQRPLLYVRTLILPSSTPAMLHPPDLPSVVYSQSPLPPSRHWRRPPPRATVLRTPETPPPPGDAGASPSPDPFHVSPSSFGALMPQDLFGWLPALSGGHCLGW